MLFDEEAGPGRGLPADLQAVYGGDWRLPSPPPGRPLTFTNFVVSHDGRISFDESRRSGGSDVSRGIAHDTWLMALIRARADAILTGAGTLRAARSHRWLPSETFPAEEGRLAALRAAEGRSPVPLLVVVSGSGDLPDAAAMRVPGRAVLVATTRAGERRARLTQAGLPHISYHVSPGDGVDLAAVMAELRTSYGVGTLLSEGGARIYGELIASRLIDEVFTTISPIVVGNRAPPAALRPGLVEGVAFDPDDPPRLRLVSLRRHSDYLFQRARFAWTA